MAASVGSGCGELKYVDEIACALKINSTCGVMAIIRFIKL